jgi:hypothetical protein
MSKKDLDSLCDELRTVLKHELERGNHIMAVETGWSKVKLAVRMTDPLDMEFAKTAAANNPDLEIWESRDVKNPQESGLQCKSHRQSISGKI